MKELNKVKLQDAVVLDEEEMKLISGGEPYFFCCYSDGTAVGPYKGSGFCPDNGIMC